MLYEVLYYDGWGMAPAYYLLDSVEGDTPKQALASHLAQATRQVRELFTLREQDISDEKIQETIYVLREDGLVSKRDLERLPRSKRQRKPSSRAAQKSARRPGPTVHV